MQQRQPSATVSATSELKPQPPTEEVVGWSALRHGRFRFALNPHLAEDAMKSDDCPIPPSTTSGDAVNAEAEVEGNGRNAVNCCTDTEPRVECVLQCSVVNALSSAYTSSGYPSVVATGTTKGSVYGSFVDLQNPCISSITFPPRESLVIGQASEEALLGDPTSSNTFDTLLHIQWKRGAHLFSSTVTHHSQANGNGSHSAGGSNGSPKTTPQTLSQHLQQFPEGIHGISSSPNMRDLLLHSTIPTTSPQPPGDTAPPAPPPPVSPQGSAPLVHSLVAANTFNHLTVYYVVHQDGRFLYSAPIQTISASIGTRKITAQRLFQLGKEEVDPCDEHRAYDYFASGTSSTVNPPTPLSSSSLPPRTRPAGGNGTPPIHGKPHFRKGVPFVPCHVPQAAGDVLFNTSTSSFSSSAHFRGARADTRTVQAARLGFVLEPLLLVGNQNGDIFVLSLLEEKIVDRLNYNAGSSQTNSNDLVSTGGKVVCSPVSTIVEVQNGLEKKVVQMVDAAMVAKQSGASELCLSESVCHGSRMDYYQLPPSLFAVGFDHGQVLLVCITTEGGWMLRYFDSSHFGHRPIKCIAPRLPSFFMRLWAHYAPEGSYSSSDQPRELLIASMDTLVVMDEEQHVAAISCCNGTIVLVRLPSLEVLGSVSVTEFNAVGDLLSLTWTCSFPERLLTPDILLASGVDDTISVFLFQDDWRRSEFESSGDYPRERPLCILERQRFHRSWVNHVTTLPLALSERVSGGGMPKYVGTCLVGTSYDSTISFWPMLFDEEDIKEEDSASQVAGSQLESVNATIKQKLFLVDGPTAAHQLHTELVLASEVVGGGTSFFMATICCRGKLKLWSVELKGLDGG